MKQAHCAMKALEEGCKLVSSRLERFGAVVGDFWVRGTHRQERGALTGLGAHRAHLPFKITIGTAHWAIRVAHRGKTLRNHPFHRNFLWSSSN